MLVVLAVNESITVTNLSVVKSSNNCSATAFAQEENFQWLGMESQKNFLKMLGNWNPFDKSTRTSSRKATYTVQRNHSRSTDQSSTSTRLSHKIKKTTNRRLNYQTCRKMGVSPGDILVCIKANAPSHPSMQPKVRKKKCIQHSHLLQLV